MQTSVSDVLVFCVTCSDLSTTPTKINGLLVAGQTSIFMGRVHQHNDVCMAKTTAAPCDRWIENENMTCTAPAWPDACKSSKAMKLNIAREKLTHCPVASRLATHFMMKLSQLKSFHLTASKVNMTQWLGKSSAYSHRFRQGSDSVSVLVPHPKDGASIPVWQVLVPWKPPQRLGHIVM